LAVGEMLEDAVVILAGLKAGEAFAASGCLKLRYAVLVAVGGPSVAASASANAGT
jgi:hypothetical protein